MSWEGILFWLITMAVGATGGLLLNRMKVPAGPMVGSMLFVSVFHILTDRAMFPAEFRTVLQVCSGALVGTRINKADLMIVRKMPLALISLVLGMLALNLGIGFLIRSNSSLSWATALFSAAPGGLSDMALIADELGANAGQVSVLQMVRLFSILLFLPPVFKLISVREKKRAAAIDNGQIDTAIQTMDINITTASLPEKQPDTPGQGSDAPAKKARVTPPWLPKLGMTMGVAVAGGTLGYMLGVPAGAMVGAMVFTTVFGILTGKGYFPKNARTGLQIFAGSYIGSQMSMANFLSMGEIVIPILCITLGVFLSTFLIGTLMHKLSGLDRNSCLLSCTPGGLQEMSLLAEDMGCQAATVSIMQTLRLFTVILLFPSILTWIVTIAV